MIFRILLASLLVSGPVSSFASTAFFQARIENNQVLMNVGGDPAEEIITLMDKAGVSKTVSPNGDPTYTASPLWAFSKTMAGRTGYSFFTRAPLTDSSWSLTSTATGNELFLDNASSKVLYGILKNAGLSETVGGPVSTLKSTWVTCDQRNFNPAKPFWVCVIKD